MEAAHSSHGDQFAIATKLGITSRVYESIRGQNMDRSVGLEMFLRLPDIQALERLWDHAAENLKKQEEVRIFQKVPTSARAGLLAENKGVVAAPAAVHGKVLEVVKEVLAKK